MVLDNWVSGFEVVIPLGIVFTVITGSGDHRQACELLLDLKET